MLIDTSGWLCLYHKDEVDHDKSVEIYNNSIPYLTSSYILSEFVPLALVRGFPEKKA